MYSETLKKMVQNKKGYRTENFSGSGIRNLLETIEFEVTEFCSTDIIDYVQDNYDLLDNLRVDTEEELIDLCIDNIEEIIKTITSYCLDYFNVKDIDELYALWLVDYENAKSYYNCNEEDGIDEYSLNREFLALSDIDTDGALFVFKY